MRPLCFRGEETSAFFVEVTLLRLGRHAQPAIMFRHGDQSESLAQNRDEI